MDPIADLISRLKISKQKTIVFKVKKNTNVSFPSYSGMKVYLVNKGPFYVKVDGIEKTSMLDTGDVFILSSGKSFHIYDNPHSKPIDVTTIRLNEGRTSFFANGPSELVFVGCRFSFKSGDPLNMLHNMPEPLIVRHQGENSLGLDTFMSHLFSEVNTTNQGSDLVTEHLLHIILMKSLRIAVNSGQFSAENSWFNALYDKNIAPVLNHIHGDIGKTWRIDELANIACMSRRSFTSKFRALTGYSVVDYISRWRFSLAIEKIARHEVSISTVALELGYSSVSSFSYSFKKAMGLSPRNYIDKAARDE